MRCQWKTIARISVLLLWGVLSCSGALGQEAAKGDLYGVVELSFEGPQQSRADVPARDIDFWVRYRHESGAPEYKIQGFWDGDGKGATSGNVFKVRFCPT